MTDYFFFGPREELLFGALHSPEAPGKHGLLICGPGLEEHHRSIWLLRSLSDQLAREGWCSMRFDYFGTGDSYGNSLIALPSRWSKDILVAAEEFMGRTSVTTLSFLCLRLGAPLLSKVNFEEIKNLGLKIGCLVLWDAVDSGETYLAELTQQEEFRLKHQRQDFSKFLDPGRPELLGYALSPARRNETERLKFDSDNIARYFDQKMILRVGSGNIRWSRQLNLEDGFLQSDVSAEVVSFLKKMGNADVS